MDGDYTWRILEDTTESFFLSPLVDYLPASKTVPTPKAVLGDIAGAKGNRVGIDHRWHRPEQGTPRDARRSAHDQAGRWAGGEAGAGHGSDLLHHRHDPLAGSRCADGADGDGLSPRRRLARHGAARSCTSTA